MKPFRNAILQGTTLLLIGTTLGFAANSVRTGGIKPFFNYFDRTRGAQTDQTAEQGRSVTAPSAGAEIEKTTAPGTVPAPAPPASKKLDHEFQVATFEDIVAAFNDPKYEQGLYIFVDARNDEAFGNGHIPGAIQADHYQLERYIDAVKERAVAADKVFVYCNGGDCEDSIFMCGDLMEYGIARDVLYLYEGGWKEWVARNMPVESSEGEVE